MTHAIAFLEGREVARVFTDFSAAHRWWEARYNPSSFISPIFGVVFDGITGRRLVMIDSPSDLEGYAMDVVMKKTTNRRRRTSRRQG
jgi:hypothetical protein